MEKIKDRLTLGIVAGLGGNIVKLIISEYAKKRNWAEIDGPERAAGMLIQPYKITTTRGRLSAGLPTLLLQACLAFQQFTCFQSLEKIKLFLKVLFQVV